MRGLGANRLAQAAERVRWQLFRAYRQLAQEGAITEEQLRDVEWLLQHLGEVTAEELRARLRAIARPGSNQAAGGGEAA